MNCFYRISGTVTFPEGLAAGEGREANFTDVARDGMGRFLLRGTSITGTIRSALAEWGVPEKTISFWFGNAKDGKNDFKASQIMVSDMVLEVGKQNAEVRTHNAIDRKTGVTLNNALFDVELLPPGTSGRLLIYIMPRDNQPAEPILQALKNVFANSMLVGGNKNRGIGRMDASKVECFCFDCSTVEGYSLWQDVRYADRLGKEINLSPYQKIKLDGEDSLCVTSFDVDFKIPDGEDLAVGYGKDMEGNLCAQQFVYDVDGKRHWRIPGSTFRGVIRAWMTRLAVLDGVEEQILDLFGTMERCGRIHFSDAFCLADADVYEQRRTHVSVDLFSGGANAGALFNNKVLVGPGVFKMKISVRAPKIKELEWLKRTLLAIHLGVVSIGNSKASGLLEISNWNVLKSKFESLENAVNG